MCFLTLNLDPALEAEVRRLAEQLGSDPSAFASGLLQSHMLRLQAALDDYRNRRISVGRFAERLGMGVIEADQLLFRLGAQHVLSAEEVRKDVETLERVLRAAGR